MTETACCPLCGTELPLDDNLPLGSTTKCRCVVYGPGGIKRNRSWVVGEQLGFEVNGLETTHSRWVPA